VRRRRATSTAQPLDLKERRQQWIEALRRINERLVDLRQQRHRFQELAAIADRTPEMKGYFILDVTRWWAVFAAMAVRREMDLDSDVESLAIVLRDMSRVNGDIPDCMGQPVDRTQLREHRNELRTLSRRIVELASKEIAHVTSGIEQDQRPTFNELFQCIDGLESIAVRYNAMLSGTGQLTRDDGTHIDVRLAGANRS
jgi:chromosome segregation ATPase